MKYISKDSRTGYPEGKEVELSLEELNRTPFNVFMVSERKTKDEEEEKKEFVEKERLRAQEVLCENLLNKGLSFKRVELVVKKYGSLSELLKHVNKAGIDDLTDDFIKTNYKPLDEKSKKRVKEFEDDLRDDGKRNYSNRKKKQKGE